MPFLQVPYLQWHRVCHALLAPLCQYLNQQNQSCHEKELQWIRSVSCYLLSFLVVKFICLVSFHHFTWVDCVLNSCIMQGNFRWHSAWIEQVHILCKKCLSLTWYQTHGKNTCTANSYVREKGSLYKYRKCFGLLAISDLSSKNSPF